MNAPESATLVRRVGEDVRMTERAGAVADTADQRREQMLRAALDVIEERGFPDTRIADVAARAGTSPALVIYYFKTKDQLLTEALRYAEDTWYEAGMRRIATMPSAARRLEELVAITFVEDVEGEPTGSWLLWLDLWSASVRLPEVASVRQKFDDRWRETITAVVLAGQEAGEFGPVDADDFAVALSALLDGLAIQIALQDPSVGANRAFELSMRFAAGQLGFDWSGRSPGK
jgi:AcrR family transcriptional regulator